MSRNQYNNKSNGNNRNNIKNIKNIPQPKISHQQAVTIWNTLTPQQQFQFNEMFRDLQEGKLMLKDVNVDDNEQIQNIVLEHKDKPSKPTAPFAKYFDQEIIKGNE